MYFKLSKFGESLSDAIESVKLDPHFFKGYLRQSAVYISRGDHESAEKLLQQVKKNCPKLTDKEKIDLKQEFERVMNLKSVIEQLNKSLSKSDHRGTVYYSSQLMQMCQDGTQYKIIKAEALVQQQKYQDAQSIVSDVLRLEPKNPDAMYVRGLTFYYLDSFDKATEHFKQTLKLDPDHSKANPAFKKLQSFKKKKEEGNLAFQSGKLDESIRLYTEALHVDSSNGLANAKLYYNRSLAFSKVSNLHCIHTWFLN